jgi:hypothetical protein
LIPDSDQLVVRVEKTRAKENPSNSLISKMETSIENCDNSFLLYGGLKHLELMPQATKLSQIVSSRERQNKQAEPEC